MLTIEIKDLSEFIAWMIQSGIPFMIYPPSDPVKERDDINCGINSPEGKPTDQSRPEEERTVLEAIDRMIENCLLTGTTPTLEDAATVVEMKQSSIKRQIQKQQGMTFYQYCLAKKMDYAAELLRMGCNAKSTSQKIGYIHPIKFNKMFQRQYGMTPHQYRKMHECNEVSLGK